MEEKFEDKSICEKCGGLCCKKSGCGYVIEDFPSFKLMDLKAKLDEGNISIKTVLYTHTVNGRDKLDKILVLKARSVDKDIVDLFSVSSQCKMLTPNGCAYSLAERPSLGAFLKPSLNGSCKIDDELQLKTIHDWQSHQAVLEKLVKVYTGKNADRVYSEQFVKATAPVLAKSRLLRGDISRLSLAEQEVLETAQSVSGELPYEFKEASQIADKMVLLALNK